jgi:phosphoglycolate phosphatase
MDRGMPSLPIDLIRTEASSGARGLLGMGFQIKPGDPSYEEMCNEFLNFYEERLCQDTILFPGVNELLDEIESHNLLWGIVTNKARRFTGPLLEQLGLASRVSCVVCGGDTANFKPHPEPLLAAINILNVAPSECIYLGDDIRDVEASLAAGIEPIVAMYGYLGDCGVAPESWGAKHLIENPQDLLRHI